MIETEPIKKKGIPRIHTKRGSLNLSPEQYQKRCENLKRYTEKRLKCVKEFYKRYNEEKTMKQLIDLHDKIGNEVVPKDELETEKVVSNKLVNDYEETILEYEEQIEDLNGDIEALHEENEKLRHIIKKVGYWCKSSLQKEYLEVFGEPYVE